MITIIKRFDKAAGARTCFNKIARSASVVKVGDHHLHGPVINAVVKGTVVELHAGALFAATSLLTHATLQTVTDRDGWTDVTGQERGEN